MSISVKNLSAEKKAVVWLAEAFDTVLVYLNSEHVSLGFRVAFYSKESETRIYTLRNIKEIIHKNEVDDDGITCEDPDTFDSSLTVQEKLQESLPENYKKICEPRQVGQYDRNTKVHAVPISEKRSFKNLAIIEEIFSSFKDTIKAMVSKDFFEEIETTDVSKIDMYRIARAAAIKTLSKKFIGKNKNNTINRNEFYEALCLVSSEAYEGSQNHGVIIYDNKNIKGPSYVGFVEHVMIKRENVRQIRKLLEMSSDNNALVIKEGEITGIYKQAIQGGTGIRFKGNGKWQMFTSANGSLIQFILLLLNCLISR